MKYICLDRPRGVMHLWRNWEDVPEDLGQLLLIVPDDDNLVKLWLYSQLELKEMEDAHV